MLQIGSKNSEGELSEGTRLLGEVQRDMFHKLNDNDDDDDDPVTPPVSIMM